MLATSSQNQNQSQNQSHQQQQQIPVNGDGTSLRSSPINASNVKANISTMSPENPKNKNMLNDDVVNTGNSTNTSTSSNSSSNNNSNNSNNNNNNNSGNGSSSGISINNSVSNDVGTTSSNVINATNVLRQNTTNVSNVMSSSPNNGSDHSNCSNISQLVEASTDLLQDEKKKNKNSIKEEDNIKTAAKNDKSNNCNNNTKNCGVNQLVSVKEETTDILSGLVNVKKEENLSPHMSPNGFGSIGSAATGNPSDCPGRSCTPAVKMEHSTNSSSIVVGGSNNEKLTGNLGLNSDDNGGSGNAINDICSAGSGNGNSMAGLSGGGQSGPGNFVTSNSGGHMGTCMDYMQQQNHIFVFSTQLANKGAESVLSGQFQTIIAYHCTQPATKNFLEDFFLKNPMKMNKLQRQNSLHMCNIPGANGPPWMTGNVNVVGSVPLSKMQTKTNSGKAHVNQSDIGNKTSSMRANTNVPNNFVEGTDSLPNENDLMCWDHTRSDLEVTGTDSQTMKLLEGGSTDVGSLNKCDSSNDNIIPSLQGVKVPDENLTPQQRQHRDEQLAKLKKINQFLFPENDSAPNMTTQNQLNKLVNENLSNNVSPNLLNIAAGNNGSAIANATLNAGMRQMQSNMMIQTKGDHMPGSLGDDVMLPADIMGDLGTGSGPGIQCNNTQKNSGPGMGSQGNVSCGPGGINVNVANITGNNMQCHGGPNANIMSNSPELMGAFGGPNCGVGIGDNVKNVSNVEMPPGMAQLEWSKMQQQFFEERLKGNKPGGTRSGAGLSMPGGLTVTAGNSGPNQALRNNQGPPPPYHPTQRSASVPIATQSPNPSSPNNPTSNLSLPSPRTTGALGIPANSPNMDVPTTSTAGSTATSSAAVLSVTGNSSTSKNCFQPDSGSPSNRNRGTSGGNLNHFNSNPSTPLSHMSPKDLESFNTNASTTNPGDLKNTRPSPQRPRSPGNANNLLDSASMDARFPPSSPGLNFNPQMQNNPNTAINSYKGTGPASGPNLLERQNSGPSGPSQFCRRTDNLPLNPNSSRPTQNKLNQNFDPISSLAQMSQQLTSCVSGVGNTSGGMNVMGSNDMNVVNQSMDGMMPSLDVNGIDHMNNTGSFVSGSIGSNNCHPMNPLMNPMGQRMLNPKMCNAGPGFNPGLSGPGPNFHGVMTPTTRMIGRMPVNFGNFNVSPNIQVKASTPNTIQYMPVRPQNNNNNVRMPPSLEFLQRYANPQMTGTGPMGSNDNSHLIGGPISTNSPNDQNKIGGNSSNMTVGSGGSNVGGMNFFQNCNQMPGMDDEGLPNGMMPPHDINIGQPMIRGMRPHSMRQHSMGPRMQTPGGNIIGGQQSQYPGAIPDGLDCNDPTALFNSSGPCNNNPSGQNMFGVAPQQQKQMKPMPPGMCQNINVGNASGGNSIVQGNGSVPGAGMLSNDMGPGMQPGNGPVMMSGNISSGPGPGNNGNPSYKPFVGPSSNDLKYAQQYHSFQQQLYATTTRSQQQQQGPNNVNNLMAPNLSPNPAFFANK